MRTYHKVTRTVGEVHGHQLTPMQRAVFLGLLAREAVSAVVACRRAEPLGGWAMSSMPEADLYGHLLAEACNALPITPGRGALTITPDGGRYARARLDVARSVVTASLAAAGHEGPLRVVFGDSAATAGLQVADVVANSVFGMLTRAGPVADLLTPLIEAGRLRILPLRLEGVRPNWTTGP